MPISHSPQHEIKPDSIYAKENKNQIHPLLYPTSARANQEDSSHPIVQLTPSAQKKNKNKNLANSPGQNVDKRLDSLPKICIEELKEMTASDRPAVSQALLYVHWLAA
eukprot:GHVT01011900.1.p2 GENE.GHVT01011900.1~~GHVT01011900.1.p2  ORF type:complete len:108 (-),score=22.65 GHVT01011900.1:488-811(-)